MERRQFLAALAAFGGGVISSSTLQALEKIGPFPPASTGGAEHAFLLSLVDTIVPRTETPGAADVGVVDFVLQYSQQLMEIDERERFQQGLQSFNEAYPAFSSGTAAKRESVLRELLSNGTDQMTKSLLKLRELTILGYYNTEAGASLELAYDPVPGPFHQVSIEDYDRTWAS